MKRQQTRNQASSRFTHYDAAEQAGLVPKRDHKRDQKYKYADRRWKRLRDEKLRRNPLCEICDAMGIVTATQVVHHVVPHGGFDGELYYDIDNLQSLCAACHNRWGSESDAHGYHSAFGIDGLPIDKRHPAYK